MLTSEGRLLGSTEPWYAGMLQTDPSRGKTNEEINPVHYLNVEVKEENEEYEKELSSDSENNTPPVAPCESSIVPEFIKAEIGEPDQNATFFPEAGATRETEQLFNCADLGECQRFQLEKIQQIYPLLYPRYLDNGEKLPFLKCPDSVQQITKGRKVRRVPNRVLRLPMGPLEAQRILRRRELNRRRRACKRAQETEEEKSLRREKERLAKAAKRAAEPPEKRMMRRERDRIAKALSRAAETEEQRRIRREKNRLAMAALRAAQTEEERFIRREKDRIKKATVRAFETEEQKRIRREKNRIAMSIRRANLTDRERSYLKNVNWVSKAASRSCLGEEEKALVILGQGDPLALPRGKPRVRLNEPADGEPGWERLVQLGARLARDIERDSLRLPNSGAGDANQSAPSFSESVVT